MCVVRLCVYMYMYVISRCVLDMSHRHFVQGERFEGQSEHVAS